MKTFGIIGTAGRRTDFNSLNICLYQWMKEEANRIITHLHPDLTVGDCALVSGAAAWSDHIAVALFLEDKAKALTLHLPAPYNMETGEFEDSEDGRIANYYHKKFSRKCYMQDNATLSEIGFAIKKGAVITINKGFFVRNALVAKDSDVMIAFTFGNGPRLKDGGTAHTMSLFLMNLNKNPKYSWHVDLNTKVVWSPAQT